MLRHQFRTLGDEWKINDFYRKIGVILDALELQLKTSAFAVGKNYSIADVYLTALIARLDSLRLGYLWEEEDRPSVSEYVKRMKSRPSYNKIFQQDSVPRLFSDGFFFKAVMARVAIPVSLLVVAVILILVL